MLVQGDRGAGVRLGQFVDLWDTEVWAFDIRTQGGLSIDMYQGELERYLTLRGEMEKRIGRYVKLRGGIGLSGWEEYHLNYSLGFEMSILGMKKNMTE
jgi:hypothetical protein